MIHNGCRHEFSCSYRSVNVTVDQLHQANVRSEPRAPFTRSKSMRAGDRGLDLQAVVVGVSIHRDSSGTGYNGACECAFRLVNQNQITRQEKALVGGSWTSGRTTRPWALGMGCDPTSRLPSIGSLDHPQL
jgi:hypothetical protein